MNVFMVGWEFPPFISGGLGTACYGLTKAMDRMGIKINFVLPKAAGGALSENLNLLAPGCKGTGCGEFKNIKFNIVQSSLQAYTDFGDYQSRLEQLKESRKACGTAEGCEDFDDEALRFGNSLCQEVNRYAGEVARLAGSKNFDIVHAHDWMTFPAGAAAAKISGKPLVAHVHSTEFDRSGENVNQVIYDIERRGMHLARRVIAVSEFTRGIIIKRYGVSERKVEVVYNGVEQERLDRWAETTQKKKNDRLVLYLGRITMQKGPEYFIAAAKKVLEKVDDVKFVMAGSGDMMHRMVAMAANQGLGKKVLFTGFLRGDQVARAYRMADLFVMPSVSEPFGIAPLEAINHNVPVIISKQSGISEILVNALRVDFWDINEMANKMVAVLKYKPLKASLIKNGSEEVKQFRWENSARMCVDIYNDVLRTA